MKIIGNISLEGDKSISHRALILASMCQGESVIKNLPSSEDILSTINCLKATGINIRINDGCATVHGQTFHSPSIDLNCGNSGTSMRLLAGLYSSIQLSVTLCGDTSLSQRPMNRIIDNTIKTNSEKIKVTTLDKLLRNEKNISVIKIDVEGYEKQVLEGSYELLMNQSLNVIIIELNNSNEFYNYHEDETLCILEKYGFKPYTYSYRKELLVPLVKKNYKSYNTIFIRNVDIVKERINSKTVVINRNRISIEKTVI